MRLFLNRIYGSLKRRIVPELRYSQGIYEDILKSTVKDKSNWLDVGCGHHLLPPWRLEQEKELIGRAKSIVGMDLDFVSITKHKTITQGVQCTADALPFDKEQFDIVTANMVVEHFDNPFLQFGEINRVLKINGILIFHTVNMRGYFVILRRLVPSFVVSRLVNLLDGRPSVDVFDVQYKANEGEKIKRLAIETGFELKKIKYVSSDAVFALIPPLAVFELVWIKLLMLGRLKEFRTNLIVILQKKSCDI